MRDFKIKFDYDLSEFEQLANACIEEIREESGSILRKSVKVFANAAAKATWPNRGKASIERRLYFRPLLSLKKLIAGEYGKWRPSEIDKHQLKNGMKFKVVSTKEGQKGRAYAYTKSLAEAKKLSKIQTRGLARAMWGTSTPMIGVEIPLGIQNLLRKASKLSSLPYSKTRYFENQDVQTVEVENKASNIDKAGRDAVSYADKAVAKELRYRLAAIARKEHRI